MGNAGLVGVDLFDRGGNKLPFELSYALREILEPAGLSVTTEPVCEAESSEYGAARFELNHQSIVFRVAKITPRKVGQFVTLWKRPVIGGEIEPLHVDDGIDFVIVYVADGDQRGAFIFDRAVLQAQKIFSSARGEGKRAIRVYPPWVAPTAPQAIKTQRWQLAYFVSTSAACRKLLEKRVW